MIPINGGRRYFIIAIVSPYISPVLYTIAESSMSTVPVGRTTDRKTTWMSINQALTTTEPRASAMLLHLESGKCEYDWLQRDC
jgi:hypothetical protein